LLKPAALLILCGALAGCASSASEEWTKPGATKEQANKDSADCLFDAQIVGPGRPAGPVITVDQGSVSSVHGQSRLHVDEVSPALGRYLTQVCVR
jgi:hypothetical protein